MFGLPTSTTLIMGGVMAFWIIYTLVFYFSTSRWSVEDDDYTSAPSESDGVSEAHENSPRTGRGGEHL